MTNCLNGIMLKFDQYKNGKDSIITYTNPEYYLQSLQVLFERVTTPKQMQNKDKFRQLGQLDIHNYTEQIIREVRYYTAQKTLFLNEYDKASPQNKVIYWGALFDSLLNFFIDNSLVGAQEYKIISKSEYDQMPKRYRSAVKKYDNDYTISSTSKSKMTLECTDDTAFIRLANEAEKLIKKIYNSKQITTGNLIEYQSGYDEDGNPWWFEKYECINVAVKSSASRFQQQFVTDEQISAIRRLRTIFTNIAEMTYFVQHKSNAKDIIWEYETAKSNQNDFLYAQRHLRTANQVVVSAKKYPGLFDQKYLSNVEKRYKNTREQVLQTLINKHNINARR